MTEVIRGDGDSAQISTQWNYKAKTPQDVAKIHPRNVAHGNFTFRNSISLRFGK